MPGLFELQRGEAPLIVDVPHAGTFLPADLRERLTPVARTVPDTDWHVEKLYAFVPGTGATLLQATHSRYVVDLNRDPAGNALYAGADNTELCPTRTFDNEPIYAADVPGQDEIAVRTRDSFWSYHRVLEAEIRRLRARHGYVVVLDGHSIRARVPRFFAGLLPDFNLGTVDGRSCAPSLQTLAADLLAASPPFTSVVNGRFKGGWITRRYGTPDDGVHALQLEMAQAAYMDEAPPFPWDPARARSLASVLERLVAALLAWKPPA